MFTSFNLSAQDLDTVYVTTKKYTVEYRQRKQAREDIANGFIDILRPGILGVNIKLDSLANKYGFKYIQIGGIPNEGYEYYNDEVIKYLNRRNGEGWWGKFLKEESKLKKIEIPSLPERKDN